LAKHRYTFCYANWIEGVLGDQYYNFEHIENFCPDFYPNCLIKKTDEAKKDLSDN